MYLRSKLEGNSNNSGGNCSVPFHTSSGPDCWTTAWELLSKPNATDEVEKKPGSERHPMQKKNQNLKSDVLGVVMTMVNFH